MVSQVLNGVGWEEFQSDAVSTIQVGKVRSVQIDRLCTNQTVTLEMPQKVYDTLCTPPKPNRRTDPLYVHCAIPGSLEADFWRPGLQIFPVDTEATATHRP